MKKLAVGFFLGFFILGPVFTQTTWNKNIKKEWESYQTDPEGIDGTFYSAVVAAHSDSLEDYSRINDIKSSVPKGTSLEQLCWVVGQYYSQHPEAGNAPFGIEFLNITLFAFPSDNDPPIPFFKGLKLFQGWKEYKLNNYSLNTGSIVFGAYTVSCYSFYSLLYNDIDFSEDRDTNQIFMIVGQYLEANPKYWHKSGSEIVYMALKEAFPKK